MVFHIATTKTQLCLASKSKVKYPLPSAIWQIKLNIVLQESSHWGISNLEVLVATKFRTGTTVCPAPIIVSPPSFAVSFLNSI